ncbi:hypothetical protein GCM10022225_73300 [Plantactinospora mayteni]|uniref:Secreted protein n=1 Tax=Plantactinospora mayteni TaxID=566021 RepID=A0ABQ4F1J8_9ACTN|nr:hypothetical protein Pma05_73570 [Plantactinospora mayteni]
MVAALAATVARNPVPISAPMVEVVVARVAFAVVVIVPSSGCVDRLRAGLSPGLRIAPAPIDRYAKIFRRYSRVPTRRGRPRPRYRA